MASITELSNGYFLNTGKLAEKAKLDNDEKKVLDNKLGQGNINLETAFNNIANLDSNTALQTTQTNDANLRETKIEYKIFSDVFNKEAAKTDSSLTQQTVDTLKKDGVLVDKNPQAPAAAPNTTTIKVETYPTAEQIKDNAEFVRWVNMAAPDGKPIDVAMVNHLMNTISTQRIKKDWGAFTEWQDESLVNLNEDRMKYLCWRILSSSDDSIEGKSAKKAASFYTTLDMFSSTGLLPSGIDPNQLKNIGQHLKIVPKRFEESRRVSGWGSGIFGGDWLPGITNGLNKIEFIETGRADTEQNELSGITGSVANMFSVKAIPALITRFAPKVAEGILKGVIGVASGPVGWAFLAAQVVGGAINIWDYTQADGTWAKFTETKVHDECKESLGKKSFVKTFEEIRTQTPAETQQTNGSDSNLQKEEKKEQNNGGAMTINGR